MFCTGPPALPIPGVQMNRYLVTILTVLSLSACATSSKDTNSTVASTTTTPTSSDVVIAEREDDVVIDDVDAPKVPKTQVVSESTGMRCTYEKPTGSHRLVKVCRSRGEIDERREADQEFIRKVQRTPSPAGVSN